jgi:hypothetical protein
MPAMTNVYTGANGTLVLDGDDTPPGADARTILEFYEAFTVGRVTGVEVQVRTDLQEYHEVGRRHATSLHPGNIHVSGRITRAHVNGALLYLLLGRGAQTNTIPEPYVQPTMSLVLLLNDPALPDNNIVLQVMGVKFQDWAFGMPEDDFVMENVTFRALSISTFGTAAGGGAALAPAFPA